jgi:hypothetical protein
VSVGSGDEDAPGISCQWLHARRRPLTRLRCDSCSIASAALD